MFGASLRKPEKVCSNVHMLVCICSPGLTLWAELGMSPNSALYKSQILQPKLDEEQVEELREAFNLFDTDGSGMFPWQLFNDEVGENINGSQAQSTQRSSKLPCAPLDFKSRRLMSAR